MLLILKKVISCEIRNINQNKYKLSSGKISFCKSMRGYYFMKKIAHRGISAQAPENTRAAFEKMIEVGAKWLETDIDMTSDGELVLIHDDKVDRTSDSQGFINDMTLAELQEIDFGQWFSNAYGDEKIVTLSWLIDFINKHHLNVNFELKTELKGKRQTDYLTRVHQALSHVTTESKMIVSSFDVDLLAKFHQLMPQIEIGLLFEDKLPDNCVALANLVGATYIHPDVTYLTQEQTKYLIKNNFGVNVWTVNERTTFDRLKRWGVTAIFSDFPTESPN